MALELKQSLRLSQQLVMTPQLQQAIKLLQLSRLELVDLIRTEIDWEQYLDNYQTQHTAPSGGGFNTEDLPSYEATLTRGENLTEHLMEQLRMAGLMPEEERIGALIIGNLNRDGYLVVDPDLATAAPLGAGEPASAEKPTEVPAVAPEALEALRREQEARKPKSE